MVPVFVPGPCWSSTSGVGINGIGSPSDVRIGTSMFSGSGTVLVEMDGFGINFSVYDFYLFLISQCVIDVKL